MFIIALKSLGIKLSTINIFTYIFKRTKTIGKYYFLVNHWIFIITKLTTGTVMSVKFISRNFKVSIVLAHQVRGKDSFLNYKIRGSLLRRFFPTFPAFTSVFCQNVWYVCCWKRDRRPQHKIDTDILRQLFRQMPEA